MINSKAHAIQSTYVVGNAIVLNDGDSGVIVSLCTGGCEALMKSSGLYHYLYDNGQAVTVFGSVPATHSLSVNWPETNKANGNQS